MSTASPAALGIHFVQPDPSAAKIAANQPGVDSFSAFIAFHEIGLAAGQSVAYNVSGSGSANYACNRTDGTLDSAPGTQQVATAPVQVRRAFVASANGEISGVIIVAPPAPRNSSCPPGYAIGMWRSSFGQMTLTDQVNNLTFSAAGSGSQAQ